MQNNEPLYRAQLCALSPKDHNRLFEFLVYGPENAIRKVWVMCNGEVLVETFNGKRMKKLPLQVDISNNNGKTGGLVWLKEQQIDDGAVMNAISEVIYKAFKKKQSRWSLNNMIAAMQLTAKMLRFAEKKQRQYDGPSRACND